MPRSLTSTAAVTCLSGAAFGARGVGAWRTVAALACGLAVLHGCRGADAVSGASATPRAALTAPVIESVSSAPVDTLTPGGVLIIEGRGFPAQQHAAAATLNGVPLTVRSATAERIEAQIPATGFACTAGTTAQVVVTVGALRVTRDLPWRSARLLAPAVGESVSLTPAEAECLQLASAPSAGGDSPRYALTIVNGHVDSAAAPAMLLRGVQPAPASLAAASLAVASFATAAPALAALSQDAAHTEHAHGTLLARSHAVAAATPFRAPQTAGTRRLGRAVQPGDTVFPRALLGSCTNAGVVPARVVYAGPTALVLEDLAGAQAGRHTHTFRGMGEEFERVMLPLLQRELGDPLATESRLGGDGRVTLLFTRVVNDSLPGTAGYVHACNLYARDQFAASNQDALLYLRLPSATETSIEYRRAMRSTLMHEGKHLASFAERLANGREFDDPWLEEATARVAEELYARTFAGVGGWRSGTGFGSSVHCELLACDDRPLIMWKHFAGLHAYLRDMSTVAPFGRQAPATNAAYAAGWSLVRWVLDHRVANETAALRQLASGRLPAGVAGLSQLAGMPVAELLAGWTGALTAASLAGITTDGDSWDVPGTLRGLSDTFGGAFAVQPIAVRSFALVQGEADLPSFRGASRVIIITAAPYSNAPIGVMERAGRSVGSLKLQLLRLL